MATVQQSRTVPSGRDDPSAGVTSGNDNPEALVRAREGTWHTFAPALLRGGLLAGVITGAVSPLYIH